MSTQKWYKLRLLVWCRRYMRPGDALQMQLTLFFGKYLNFYIFFPLFFFFCFCFCFCFCFYFYFYFCFCFCFCFCFLHTCIYIDNTMCSTRLIFFQTRLSHGGNIRDSQFLKWAITEAVKSGESVDFLISHPFPKKEKKNNDFHNVVSKLYRQSKKTGGQLLIFFSFFMQKLRNLASDSTGGSELKRSGSASSDIFLFFTNKRLDFFYWMVLKFRRWAKAIIGQRLLFSSVQTGKN